MPVKRTPSGPPAALRRRATEIARDAAPAAAMPLERLSAAKARKLVEELRIHQIELEMQNEELRRTQAELEASKAKYFELYDLMPIGYCTLNEAGLILEANLTLASLLGVELRTLIKKPLTRFIGRESQDIYFRQRRLLMESGMPQTCDLDMATDSGAHFWARLEGNLARDAAGGPVCRFVVSDITGRKRAEDALQASLREKETLVREIHHRVKNNMQVISSLLSLQAATLKDEDSRRILKEGQLRIRAMALIHEKLYQASDFSRIDFASYLKSLGVYLSQFYKIDAERVRWETDLEEVSLDISSAVPCGLLFNELVSNAFKHAFPNGRRGTVRIRLRQEKDGTVDLRIADDGVGLPPELDFAHTESLGLQIVNTLIGQIGGTITHDGSKATAFTIRFKELEARARA